MPLCELIEKTKENFIEYALHEMEYGKDWVFISWPDRAKIDENKKYKTLGQLGIKPEHVLEVFPYFTKEKMKSFPTHPSLTVHPNHYREDW